MFVLTHTSGIGVDPLSRFPLPLAAEPSHGAGHSLSKPVLTAVVGVSWAWERRLRPLGRLLCCKPALVRVLSQWAASITQRLSGEPVTRPFAWEQFLPLKQPLGFVGCPLASSLPVRGQDRVLKLAGCRFGWQVERVLELLQLLGSDGHSDEFAP